MANDVEIRVSVNNATGNGLTAVTTSMRNLKSSATNAGQALTQLDARATAAAASLLALAAAADGTSHSLDDFRARTSGARDEVNQFNTTNRSANQGLQTMNTRLNTAGGRLDDMSGHTRTLRGDLDDLDGSLSNIGDHLNAFRNSLGGASSSSSSSSSALEKLKSAAISLAPALVPIASSLAPIALEAGAAGVAVGVFGAAIKPQIGAMSDAATAQAKYTTAMQQYGPASTQAAAAQNAYLQTMSGLPPATRTAAAALTVLKAQYTDWSNSLAGDTMPVATKGMAVLGATIGKLSPLVKTSSGELSKMMTILAGGVESNGFDKLITEVDDFAAKGLQNATTGLLRFSEALSSGKADGPVQEFMAYARQNGPAVEDTFEHVGEAVENLLKASADTGVGMLQIVDSLSKIVSAVPPEAIASLLQLSLALKAVKIATAAGGAIGAGMTAFAGDIGKFRTAAAGANGVIPSLVAGFGALSKGAKIAVAGTGIGLLVIALTSLSQVGKQAPPDVDKLTTSLEKLAQTGKVSGAAADAFGKNLSGLADSLRTLAKPSGLDQVQQFMTKLVGMDSTPVAEAKDNLDAVDKALANMVQGGNAALAQQAFNDIAKSMEKNGLSATQLRGKLDDYKQALADQAMQAKLTAQSQGLFGDQALKVQQELDKQKASADGLTQSLQALDDVNQQALGGMIGFEQSISDAAKAAKTDAGALTMTHGQLDLSSQKARDAASALNDLAAKTDAATSAAVQSGKSWGDVESVYTRGESALVKYGQQMGLTKGQAEQLAKSILKVPNKTVIMKGEASQLTSQIAAAQKKVDALKQKRKTAVGADASSLNKQIAAAQAKVNSLKQKKAAAIKASNQAGAGAAAAQRSINAVHGKTVTITTNYKTNGGAQHAAGNPYFATGGITGSLGRAATGGPRSGMTLVGEQGPELVDLAAGSHVRSNPDTKRLLAGGVAQGSSQPLVINLSMDGKAMAQVLIDPLRREVRTRGGNVQAVLGRG